MGYHIDSLDMCYGIQLTDSHGDIGVIYAQELMHVFIIFSDRNFGVSLQFFVWIEYYEYEYALVLFQYELQDRSNGKNSFALFQYELVNRSNRKNSFEVVQQPTDNSYLLFSANRNLGVILYYTLRDNHMIQLCQHCWEIALVKVRTLGLVFKHFNTVFVPVYYLLPCCFYLFSL